MMTTVLLGAVLTLSLAQLVLIWHLRASVRRAEELQGRVGQLAEALKLLTDAAESGFGAVCTAIERLDRGSRRGRSRSTGQAGRRIAKAASNGKSIEEIAAAEAVSESEVRLHLGMTEGLKGDSPRVA